MKKYFIIIAILLLAAACSKKQPVVLPAPVLNEPAQNQQAASSSSPGYTITYTPQSALPPAPVNLSIYTNAAQHYKISYLSYFSLYNSAAVKANNTKGVNFSACVPYGLSPDICFVLKSQPYLTTNLGSAAVAVKVLKNKTTIGVCGTFTEQELNGGEVKGAVQGNGVVFVTAVATDAGAGNSSETRYNRAFYGTTCYEINETTRWSYAGNFSPPRQDFDKNDVWSKLDILRNGFGFIQHLP